MHRVCDYFVVCGLGEQPSKFGHVQRRDRNMDIVDVCVHFKGEEPPPQDYVIIEETRMEQRRACLDQKSQTSMSISFTRGQNIFLMYRRRGPKDTRPAISDVSVVTSYKDMPGYEIVTHTPSGHDANFGTHSKPLFLAVKREDRSLPYFHQDPVVHDICICVSLVDDELPDGFIKLDKNLNFRSSGPEVFMGLYRMLPQGICDVPFTATVLDQYPYVEYKDFALPADAIPMFCFPQGMRLTRAPYSAAPLATYFPYVLTDQTGGKVFVASVTFYEPLPLNAVRKVCKTVEDLLGPPSEAVLAHARDVSEDEEPQDQYVLWVPKCICLVSHWPFFRTFRSCLSQLYAISLSQSELPLERWISFFVSECPLPTHGGANVTFRLDARMSPIVISLPPIQGLPVFDLTFQSLFYTLDINNFMTFFALALLERKIVVISKYASVVTEVCESIRCLLFPFQWESCYVPRLTEPLLDCLEFPGGILVGVHNDTPEDPLLEHTSLMWRVREALPHDATLVDLDTNSITFCHSSAEVTWKQLPAKHARLMHDRLAALLEACHIQPGNADLTNMDSAFDMAPVPAFATIGSDGDGEAPVLDTKVVRDIALTFMSQILTGYNEHLVLPTMNWETNNTEWFSKEGFIKSIDSRTTRAFVDEMCSTQMFSQFVQKRTETSDTRLLYFDYCVQALKNLKPPSVEKSYFLQTVEGDNLKLLLDEVGDVRGHAQTTPTSSAPSPRRHSTSSERHPDEMVEHAEPSRHGLPSDGRIYTYTHNGVMLWPQQLDRALYPPVHIGSVHMMPERTRRSSSFRVLLTRDLREMETSITPSVTITPGQGKSMRGFAAIQRSMTAEDPPHTIIKQVRRMVADAFGAWFMCTPAYIHKHFDEEQALLQAFGALVLMRKVLVLPPDEVMFRALIVACGRSSSVYRSVDVLHMFQDLKDCNIRPNAITYGQYTQAIARATQMTQTQMQTPAPVQASTGLGKFAETIDPLPVQLREVGLRWRARWVVRTHSESLTSRVSEEGLPQSRQTFAQTEADEEEFLSNIESELQRLTHQSGVKVSLSWPACVVKHLHLNRKINLGADSQTPTHTRIHRTRVNVVSMWSGNTHTHIHTNNQTHTNTLLDEEVMAAWQPDESEETRMNSEQEPALLRYSVLTTFVNIPIEEPITHATAAEDAGPSRESSPRDREEDAQADPYATYSVPYLPPSELRHVMESDLRDHGDKVFDRDYLRTIDGDIFWNLWWYSTRLGLPLPLVSSYHLSMDIATNDPRDASEPHPDCDSMWVLVCGWEQECTRSAAASVVTVIADLFGAYERAYFGVCGSEVAAPPDDSEPPSPIRLKTYESMTSIGSSPSHITSLYHPLLRDYLAIQEQISNEDVTGPMGAVWAMLVGGPSNTLPSAVSNRVSERGIPPRIPSPIEEQMQVERVSAALSAFLHARREGTLEDKGQMGAYRELLLLNFRHIDRTHIGTITHSQQLTILTKNRSRSIIGSSTFQLQQPTHRPMYSSFDRAYMRAVQNLSSEDKKLLLEVDKVIGPRAMVFRSLFGQMA